MTEHDRLTVKYSDALSAYMRCSPFFLAPPDKSSLKIDRYSDKYLAHLKRAEGTGKILAITTDLSFFPEELHSVYDPEKAKRMASRSQAVPQQPSFGDALAKLKDLESKESEAKDASDEDGEGEDEVVYDEEEFEDETDYNLNYFDNGEDYGDYGDDGDDGPVY